MVLAFYDADQALLHRNSFANHPAVRLQYLNEGGANLVYKLLPTRSNDVHSDLKGKLLRIRKDKAHTRPVYQQLHAHSEHFASLLADGHLLDHSLINIDKDLRHAIKDDLIVRTPRRAGRHGEFLHLDEPHALLMTDMTPMEGDTVLEMKPKWLAQSPSAPAGARRCRTCALRAQRRTKGQQTATDMQALCPLSLVHEDRDIRLQAAKTLTDDETLQVYLVNDGQTTLQTLKSQQQCFDPSGVLVCSESQQNDLAKAMTLRDCTLFLRLRGGQVTAKLGDLDLKSTDKISGWADVENSLIDGGWYTEADKDELCMLAC